MFKLLLGFEFSMIACLGLIVSDGQAEIRWLDPEEAAVYVIECSPKFASRELELRYVWGRCCGRLMAGDRTRQCFSSKDRVRTSQLRF